MKTFEVRGGSNTTLPDVSFALGRSGAEHANPLRAHLSHFCLGQCLSEGMHYNDEYNHSTDVQLLPVYLLFIPSAKSAFLIVERSPPRL